MSLVDRWRPAHPPGIVTSWLAWLWTLYLQDQEHISTRHGVPQECSLAPTHNKGHSVANIKSQIKRNKTNIIATERNRAVKSEVRTTVRQARAAIKAGDKEKATAAVAVASRKLDKAVSKGVLHKNQAANRKSAITKQAAAL